jgi:hypothetical protein
VAGHHGRQKTPPESLAGGGRGAKPKDSDTSTPIELNDAHASQAAKELENSVGLDLEEFLNSKNLRDVLVKTPQESSFKLGAAPDSKGRNHQ